MVEPGVLIPRPETEEMAAMIISENRGYTGTVTDLCTGSGCIAIALVDGISRCEGCGNG
ncbi:MAG: hypothetical protein MZV63_64175 [Marinilabiliales bacterium]|nr:hypothetical protein [Marinilabiliales bacterium]